MKALKKIINCIAFLAFFFSLMAIGGEMDRISEADPDYSYVKLACLMVTMVTTFLILKFGEHGNCSR